MATYIHQCPHCGVVHENPCNAKEQCDKCLKKCTDGTALAGLPAGSIGASTSSAMKTAR